MRGPKLIFALAAAAVSMVVEAQAQMPASRKEVSKSKAQRYIELVSANEILKNSSFGVLALTKGGDTLAAWDNGKRLIPASTMKLISAGTAMHQFGPDFKFTTRIGYTGTIKDGVLDGDLYIVGGGDPTIASKDSIALTQNALFGQWKGFLDKAGIKKINGYVIGDGRYFDGPIDRDTWSYQDIGTAYGTGGDGLCFYENAIDMRVSPGPTVGSPVPVVLSTPSLPWMKFSFNCRTGKAGTGDQLYMFTSEFQPYAEVRGTFALDRKSKVEEFSNKFGAYTCAHFFCEYLRARGVQVALGPADVRLGKVRSNLLSLEPGPYASKVDDLKMIGTSYSPSLKRIVRETLLSSDNFYAETLFRILGRRLHHSASPDSCVLAVQDVIKKLGVDPSGVKIDDGSGLSRFNYVSPEFFTGFLSAMMDSPVFGDFIETLGQPGGRHYESRLRGENEQVRSRVHLKSGSMGGVRCFSGYIEPSLGSKQETIIFSIMTNNVLVPASKVDPIIDRIISLLASENL
ncbi:MAG: D-alanyl-D-alanine carboxypeptidase/D-alanyl-D-alanine-endopeptidase [Bacteroidales bacterium]|nr:D-alanyl-D-alanine carboxypeptidase/D-alanyl-D-alanine-endopeptidase [Bacteroidales bacterium]